MSASIAPPPSRLQLTLHVADLSRSAAFYEALFGLPAAVRRSDYASFVLNDPPLALSLEPAATSARGTVNRFGFPPASQAELGNLRLRLEAAGFLNERDEAAAPDSQPFSFRLNDPDGNLWEFVVSAEDPAPRTSGDAPVATGANSSQSETEVPSRNIWTHRAGRPLRIPDDVERDSLDEIHLLGTFNVPLPPQSIREFLVQCGERLRPGGKLSVQCLTGSEAVADPALPGTASNIQHVPRIEDVVGWLDATGFQGVELATYRPRPCFVREGVEMRETLLHAREPVFAIEEAVSIVYKGPFAQLTLPGGTQLFPGRRTLISAAEWREIKALGAEHRFVKLEAADGPVAS